MIIDELRADMMKYPDLLRILDPFGSQVMAPSRYSDKPLVCDLILITSPYNPAEFYGELFGKTNGDSVDGLEQLLRRITLTVEMDTSHIRAVEYDREKKLTGLWTRLKKKTSIPSNTGKRTAPTVIQKTFLNPCSVRLHVWKLIVTLL